MAEEKTFNLTTSAQVERSYVVKATSKEQAHARLKAFMGDPDAVREGIVHPQAKLVNKTPEKIKVADIAEVPKAKAPGGPAAASAGTGVPQNDPEPALA